MQEIWSAFLKGLLETSLWEAIAVIAGIASVWYSRAENILVYPVGLINTITYIFLSINVHLYGEATVNLYYTVMSIYGWVLWLKKNEQQQRVVTIQFSNRKELVQQILFFFFFYIVIYFVLQYLKKSFSPGAIPFADALASASAFTGMWLMAKKGRKLVLVDRNQYMLHTSVFYKGIRVYQCVLSCTSNSRFCRIGRMV